MDQRYPDATEAELEASDKICIICREEMTSAKKLTCGHLFHFRCLKSWLERQQACPTCRRSILDPPETPANPEHNEDVQNLNIIEGEIRANDAPHPPELRQFSPNEHLPQVRGSLYTDIGNIPVVMINDRENIRLRLRNLLANNGSAAEQRMDESLSQPSEKEKYQKQVDEIKSFSKSSARDQIAELTRLQAHISSLIEELMCFEGSVEEMKTGEEQGDTSTD